MLSKKPFYDMKFQFFMQEKIGNAFGMLITEILSILRYCSASPLLTYLWISKFHSIRQKLFSHANRLFLSHAGVPFYTTSAKSLSAASRWLKLLKCYRDVLERLPDRQSVLVNCIPVENKFSLYTNFSK